MCEIFSRKDLFIPTFKNKVQPYFDGNDDIEAHRTAVKHHAAAWEKLRRICFDYRLQIPTLKQLNEIHASLEDASIQRGLYLKYFGDESLLHNENCIALDAVLVLKAEDGATTHLVDFNAGFIFE